MPIPKPIKYEKRDKFIVRCMKNKYMKRKFKNSKQRLAVCFESFRNN